MNLEKDQKKAFSRKLSIVSASVLMVFCLIITIQAVWTHDVALKRGQLIAERLTKIEADHIELTFNTIRLTLKGEAQRHYYNSLFTPGSHDEIEIDLRKIVSDTPQVGWLMLTNSKGDVSITASKSKYEALVKDKKNVHEEEFFKYHQSNSSRMENTRGETISVSSGNDPLSKRMIIISQPLFRFDGNFDGVIAIAVDADYFFGFFKSIEIGNQIEMAIVIKNGQLLLSEDAREKNINIIEVINSDPELKKADLTELQVKEMKINERDYIISFKKLRRTPIIVSLIFDQEGLLVGWRNDRMTDLVFLILFTVFGAVLFSLILAMAKQIQRAEESEKRALLANQAKSEFFAKMSHELRTPLNAIIGFSEMIDNGYFGELNNIKQKERIHDINLCGNHLLQLINDILDYSKGEAGKLELRESEVTVPKVVEDSLRMIRDRAKRKHLEIETNLAGDLPRIFADERKLKQILLNLLSNAVKFTPENGKVTVSTVMRGNDMIITVLDTGIGIPEEDIPVALSVFGQVKNKVEPEEEGTGLGLPLCKMLVELHGGKFILESELGKWTKATIIIPPSRVIDRKIKR